MAKLSLNTVWLVGLSLLYAALLAAVTYTNSQGADRWWFGALNLYLPQAVLLIPALPLLLWALASSRGWIWLPVLCTLWVLGPIMGFCWRMSSPTPPGAAAVRVMTCNIKYGKYDIRPLIDDITRYRPDIVFLQDMKTPVKDPLKSVFEGWHVHGFGQYVIASRFPLSAPEIRPTSAPADGKTCVRCIVDIRGVPVTLYNVHLESPREGLNTFRPGKRHLPYLPKAIQRFEDNVEARLLQARKLSEYLRDEKGQTIVAGDLNSPDASLACAMLRDAGFHDAFAEGGRGYGYTYGHYLLKNRLPWLHLSWMRIDHIMATSRLHAALCWTGTGRASEHRPVFADIVMEKL